MKKFEQAGRDLHSVRIKPDPFTVFVYLTIDGGYPKARRAWLSSGRPRKDLPTPEQVNSAMRRLFRGVRVQGITPSHTKEEA